MQKTSFRHLGPFLGLLLFTTALWVLHRELQAYHYADILRDIESLPPSNLLWGVALTLFNYAIMTGYDALAFRYLGHPLARGKIALASFIGYAFSNNVGLSMLAGSSVRYRLYSAWGLTAIEITQVIAFTTLTLWLGLFSVGGVLFLIEPLALPAGLRLPFATARPLGPILLIPVAGYLLWILGRKTPLKIRDWEFPLPSVSLSLSQIAISALDWLVAASVLYALLPPASGASYAVVLAAFLLAQIAGLLSQVPGGLGVFEMVVLLFLSPFMTASSILGSLLAYRAIYYLLPLGLASALLGAHELYEKKAGVKRAALLFGKWMPALVPHALAFATFVAGAILLFSGATPAVPARLAWLKNFIPWPVMEISHFLGSLAGIGLLLLARGLQQRLDAAYFLAAILLGGGAAFSLLKGGDYDEAVFLGIMLGALLPCRRYFYRKASLFVERFTPGWIATIVLVILGSVWMGVFAYKHVEYSTELWWRFTMSGDAPRFLRATVGVFAVALSFALAKLLRGAPPEPVFPSPRDLEKIVPILEDSPKSSARLALLGDKSILFNDAGTAFIMYGNERRSWVALGDPVGSDKDLPELIWRFHELCDRHGGWTVFYQVDRDYLPLYLDLGLTLFKLGEEGRVPLETFSLEGSARKGLRHVQRRIEREGSTFEVIPPEGVPGALPELKGVSDAWLADKKTREKGFSLGFFSPEYLKHFPIGAIRREGRIVAFANLTLGAGKEELSLDLMRFLPEAPDSVMEYLFIRVMLWGKENGYRWFNLGMAPLAGLENRPLAPLWNRIGAFVFRHGEHFYNFQGLRQYKEKFDPAWEPKYLASPGGLLLPRILTDIASLISGGLKGVIAK